MQLGKFTDDILTASLIDELNKLAPLVSESFDIAKVIIGSIIILTSCELSKNLEKDVKLSMQQYPENHGCALNEYCQHNRRHRRTNRVDRLQVTSR